jgi:hypothetical protein
VCHQTFDRDGPAMGLGGLRRTDRIELHPQSDSSSIHLALKASLPWSTKAMAAATTTGLDIEGTRNRLSRCIGRCAPGSRIPSSLIFRMRPDWQIRVTALAAGPLPFALQTEVWLPLRFTAPGILSCTAGDRCGVFRRPVEMICPGVAAA